MSSGPAEGTDPRGTHLAPAADAPAVDEEDEHRPRHLVRASPDTRTVHGGVTPGGDGEEADGATATLMPTARRPQWPASRRARAVARRRVRALGHGRSHATEGVGQPAPPTPLAPPDTAARAARTVPAGGGWGGDRLLRRRRLVLAGMATLLAGGVALALVGVDLVRNSTAGRYVERAGPDEPGYQAYVVPTPTMALVQRGDGELTGVALLALESRDDAGTVILVPAATLTRGVQPPEDGGTSEPPPTMAEVYSDAGAAGVVAAVADLLGVAIPEHLEVDDARWASLVAPVAPVELQLPEPVGEWPAGEVSLAPDDVGPFLAARADDESEVDRINRQADFWTAWLPLVRDAGVDALPGEIDVGIGRFVRGLAESPSSIVPLPGEPTGGDGEEPEAYALHGERVSELLARAVPYPVSPTPGRRIRVRLLNGTTDRDLTGAAAEVLVRGGAEITIAGNAPSFGEDETLMLYGSPEHRDQVLWLAAAFGGARVEQGPAAADGSAADDDEVDMTVILGDDARDLIGR